MLAGKGEETVNRELVGPAVVRSVEAGSPAERAGVQPGDRIQRIDGEYLRDMIDFQLLLLDDVAHSLEIERSGATVRVTVEALGRPVGIEMEKAIFGDIMTCNNACMFCFIDQLPGGLRETMYIKDDDYRLSFLGGNFITLTNLENGDIRRIVEDRLSPLYVSLHATEPGLRGRIFGNPGADIALDALEAILDGGTRVHVQIVLIRGINDREKLDVTLDDIMSRFPGVSSVGVVPVGITTTGKTTLPMSFGHTRESASGLLEQLDHWRRILGGRGPYAADEFFYLAGEEVPAREYYNGYPQLENGIGLARKLIDEFKEAESRLGGTGKNGGTVVLSSPMGSWALSPLQLDRYGVSTVVCRNTLFGETVNVCGLLPGSDVARALGGARGAKTALLPDVALEDGVFIDGASPAGVSEFCGVDVVPVKVDGVCLAGALMDGPGVQQ